MLIGLNAVLFGGFDAETAFRCTAMAGYDAIELSALPGMAEHITFEGWRDEVPSLLKLSAEHGLPVSALEVANPDMGVLSKAFEMAGALGCPIVNIGSGGPADDESAWAATIENLARAADAAETAGILLCVKAHVGLAVHNTATSLRALAEIPNLHLDMDPSHVHRAGEDPVKALGEVANRIRHVHIRDCKGRQGPPGPPPLQANGRGDIDLVGYVRVLHEHGFDGPVNLEVIGARELDLLQCQTIAAESRGHMQASLQACGAR